MTTAEAFLKTPNDSASAAARTVGQDAATEDTVSRGAAEVFLTLADMEQQEAEAWKRLTITENQLDATELGRMVTKLRMEWSKAKDVLDATKAAMKVGLKLATG